MTLTKDQCLYLQDRRFKFSPKDNGKKGALATYQLQENFKSWRCWLKGQKKKKRDKKNLVESEMITTEGQLTSDDD